MIPNRALPTHVSCLQGSAEDKVREVIAKLRALRLTKAAELVEAKAHGNLDLLRVPEQSLATDQNE